MDLYLRSWWSREYNRPLKDPLLESYTLYDLLYEYHDKLSRERVIEEKLELEADKIEQEQEQEVLSWIEEEERKEREELEAQQKAQKSNKKDEDEKWMLEQLKKEYGEDFGEDIDLDLSE